MGRAARCGKSKQCPSITVALTLEAAVGNSSLTCSYNSVMPVSAQQFGNLGRNFAGYYIII